MPFHNTNSSLTYPFTCKLSPWIKTVGKVRLASFIVPWHSFLGDWMWTQDWTCFSMYRALGAGASQGAMGKLRIGKGNLQRVTGAQSFPFVISSLQLKTTLQEDRSCQSLAALSRLRSRRASGWEWHALWEPAVISLQFPNTCLQFSSITVRTYCSWSPCLSGE